MSAPRPRHVALRIAAGSLVALAATLAACEARMPTSVDVANMTAASAERAATTTGILSANDSLRAYFINGHRVTAAEARAVAPGQIASIAVMHDSADHSKGTVRIITRDARDAAATLASAGVPGDTHHVTIQFERKLPPGGHVTHGVPDTLVEFGVAREPHVVPRFTGLTFIDGRRVDNGAVKQLNPTDIRSVEVIKGPRATELYPNDPAAAQGVIQITTKHGTH